MDVSRPFVAGDITIRCQAATAREKSAKMTVRSTVKFTRQPSLHGYPCFRPWQGCAFRPTVLYCWEKHSEKHGKIDQTGSWSQIKQAAYAVCRRLRTPLLSFLSATLVSDGRPHHTPPPHTHTHTHHHAHTHIHTCMQTHTHTHTHAHARTHARTCTRICGHNHTYTITCNT